MTYIYLPRYAARRRNAAIDAIKEGGAPVKVDIEELSKRQMESICALIATTLVSGIISLVIVFVFIGEKV